MCRRTAAPGSGFADKGPSAYFTVLCIHRCGLLVQAVSSRPDVTPPDYLRELEKLQDQIPAFADKEAMAVMQQELGTPPSQLFSFLATSPTAAASLGQVQPPAMCEMSVHESCEANDVP